MNALEILLDRRGTLFIQPEAERFSRPEKVVYTVRVVVSLTVQPTRSVLIHNIRLLVLHEADWHECLYRSGSWPHNIAADTSANITIEMQHDAISPLRPWGEGSSVGKYAFALLGMQIDTGWLWLICRIHEYRPPTADGSAILDVLYNHQMREASLLHWATETVGCGYYNDSQSKIHLTVPLNATETTMIRVFISHSSKDTSFVTDLIGLLRSALNLPADQIRATSVDGHRLRGGDDVANTLRREVNNADAFIGVLSSNSLDSLYVAFELGARWGSGKAMVPVAMPQLDLNELRGPMAGNHVIRLTNQAAFHQLLNQLAETLLLRLENPAVYQRQLDIAIASSSKN